ncbi:MAG: hypothetical protein HY781_07490, partial [Chloroflexi bacterium]|nr:hypothetical protein [Chloroflexota bacterium]
MRLKRLLLVLTTAALLCGCIPANSPAPLPVPATATITWTPTRTSTFIPTFTFTPIPTLSPDDAYARIAAMLNSTSNCQLPCWWGIYPGLTTLQEAYDLISPLRGVGDYKYFSATDGGVAFFSYPVGSEIIYMDLGLTSLPGRNTVDIITF